MKEKTFVFIEPHLTGGDSTVTITKSKIIEYMHKRQKEPGCRFKDATDEQLLDEFCVIHWCWEQKEK